MKKILIVLPLIILVIVGFFIWRKNSALSKITCENCNVILISVDTLGAQYLDLYNPEKNTAPFLSNLAQERGIIFDKAVSQAPWTLPAHGSMFTGKYPWELNLWYPDVRNVLSKEELTIAEYLRDKGYQTTAFSNGSFVDSVFNFNQGFDQFFSETDEIYWDDAPKIFKDSLGWLKKVNTKKPFFLFIHSFHAHDPYTPKDKNLKTVTIDDIIRNNFLDATSSNDYALDALLSYESEITEVDNAFKNFYQELEKLGLLKNTVIIFTSDHGESFGQHEIIAWHTVELYNELLEVPLIIFTPQKYSTRVKQNVEVRSIPISIADLLGFDDYNIFPGISLLEAKKHKDMISLSGTGINKNGFKKIISTVIQEGIYSYSILQKTKIDWPDKKSFAAQTNDWKLLHDPDKGFELYNLMNDPGEKNNVYSSLDDLSLKEKQKVESLQNSLRNLIY